MTTATAVTAVAPGERESERHGLADLSPEGRGLYQAIPSHVDFVPHPCFRAAGAEERFFGAASVVVDVPQRRHYSELDEEPAALPKGRPQLSHSQESLLFLRYNYARYRLAGLMAAQGRRFGRSRLGPILLWYRRALDSRAMLAGANMALVVAMAKRTRINAVEFGELVSEGNMALLRAVDKFDVRRGFRFSTYACRAILKAFSRLATKTTTYRQHFPTEFDPSMERSDEIDRRHTDERELAIEDLQRVLALNQADLSEVERAVVGARFAVAGHRQAQTLEEVGRLVGLSKERVRQVQNDALAKLRAALEGQAA